jgi:putative ABC transport system permease protein
MLTVITSAAAVGVGALRENPLRTLLSTLGVIIGVASLVAVLSLGDALQAFARAEIDRMTDAQSITVESRTWHVVDGEWQPVRNVLRFSTEDFEAMAAALPEVKGAWMSRGGSARVASRRSARERTASIQAVSAGVAVTGRPRIGLGRSFTDREDRANAPVVILSWKLAEELANGRPASALLGEEVRVGSLSPGKSSASSRPRPASVATAHAFRWPAPPPRFRRRWAIPHRSRCAPARWRRWPRSNRRCRTGWPAATAGGKIGSSW